MTARRYLVPATAAALGLTVSACNVSHHTSDGPTVVTTVTHLGTPKPVKTVVRKYQTFTAGETGVLTSAAQHASLRIAVSRPSRSTTRLSPTYGDAPSHGHFVTFHLKIANTGRVPVVIQRLDFWVQTPGVKKTTTDDGTAPYSGSRTQLDTTELAPGDTVSNNLTFDVATPTGTLFYGPGGRRALAWTF